MKKILIIEDEQQIREMLQAKLKEGDFRIIQAADGDSAISLFKKHKPDLVIADVILPKKSGFEVVEEIRYRVKSEVPIIILSNLDQPQDRETAMRLGVNEYIVKSNVSLRDLMGTVMRLLKGV